MTEMTEQKIIGHIVVQRTIKEDFGDSIYFLISPAAVYEHHFPNTVEVRVLGWAQPGLLTLDRLPEMMETPVIEETIALGSVKYRHRRDVASGTSIVPVELQRYCLK